MINKVLIALFLIISCSGYSRADGLAMHNYAEVLVENLQIGQTHSMTKLVNLPLEIVNQSKKTTTIEISVLKPNEKNIKQGFDGIPDTSWIKIEPKQVEIPANGIYRTDVQIKIPDDELIMGKKYHANIQAKIIPDESKSMMRITMAVQGRFLFTVATRQRMGPKIPNDNLSFTAKPGRIMMKNLNLGKKYKIKNEDNQLFTISNENQKKMTMFVQSLDPSKTVMPIEKNYEPCPDPNFISFKKNEFDIKANRDKKIEAFIEFPNKAEYKGKKYQFIVSVTTGKQTSYTRYLRVMIETEK